MLEPHQGCVDRTFVELQDGIAHLLDAAGDTVAVLGTQGVERLQHHQVERALD
jgi:hypothetical protein